MIVFFYVSTIFGSTHKSKNRASNQSSTYDIDPARDFYKNIQDICNPTQKELLTLQDNLLKTHRPILNQMKETGFIPREFKFIGTTEEETPSSGKLVLNCSEEERENCIILYSSFNARYRLGVRRLLDYLSISDYKGHVYYKIGGWPNIEYGDLALAHVPFAFKPCFFKEVETKGYKKILWLDASIIPSPGVSLNFIFEIISHLGCFIQAGDHSIGPYMNPESAKAFGLTMKETNKILSCSAAIIGIDLTDPKAKLLIDSWYNLAQHPYAFFSDRSDQNALSILIHQLDLKGRLIPRSFLGSLAEPKNSFFIMDRSLVKDN